MKKVGILFLHGMGESAGDYANVLIERLKKQTSVDIYTHSVHYDNVLVTEQELLKTIYAGSELNLNYSSLRNFMISYVGDAGAMTNNKNKYAYEQTHLLIKRGLQALDAAVGRGGEIIVIGHSLGCEIFSNYLWDAGKASIHENHYTRKITTFVTMGCNIPIFNSGLASVKMFKKPSDEFSWLNYYSEYDALGYPLIPLGGDYAECVTDISFNVGGWLTQFTPLCHMYYWEDRGFAKEMAKLVRSKQR